ncbi:MAG: DegT/DnrJ/EryC1/StrS family aminotransferase [Acidimicrobiales bacterium]
MNKPARPIAVPLAAPQRQTAALRSEINEAIASVLDGNALVMGPAHHAFEEAFALYCGTSFALGVGNGTDALEIALRAVGVGPGVDVVTVANAGGYTANATQAIGARPVFVDVEPNTLQMDVEQLQTALSGTTAAVVLTHLYGQMGDVEAIRSACDEAGVPLVEDCAQAHGASRSGRRAGSFGTAATFSFYPTKNLGAIGDGGMVVCDDPDIAARVRQLRQYGWGRRYSVEVPHGRNSRLDELQAAVLLRKLAYLDGWNERRRSVLGRYQSAGARELRFLGSLGQDNVAHLAVAWCDGDRDGIAEGLNAAGVGTAVHYPIPDHHQRPLVGTNSSPISLPVTERAVQHILTFPCFPEILDSEVDYVCDQLAKL